MRGLLEHSSYDDDFTDVSCTSPSDRHHQGQEPHRGPGRGHRWPQHHHLERIEQLRRALASQRVSGDVLITEQFHLAASEIQAGQS